MLARVTTTYYPSYQIKESTLEYEDEETLSTMVRNVYRAVQNELRTRHAERIGLARVKIRGATEVAIVDLDEVPEVELDRNVWGGIIAFKEPV